MSREEITVEIDQKGEVTVSVKGVKGKGCKALTKALEEALGDAKETRWTREANEQPNVQRTANRNRA